MKRLLSIAALAAVMAAVPASAYYHFIHYLPSGNAPEKFDLSALPQKTVTFFVSENGPANYAPGDNFASVLAQVRHATQVWNGVSGSDLRVAFGGLENSTTLQNTPAGDVVFEDLAPGLLGYGGPTSTNKPVTPANGSPFIPITRSAVHLNRDMTIAPGPAYSEAFFMTVVHEMGHALGLQHTFTSATMSTATTRSTSLSHPLDDDDIAGISVLYPTAALAQTGSITGTITANGSGMHLASVVAIRAGVSAISALTNPDGTYRIDGVSPGEYYVYAHALPPDADIQGPWNPDGSVVAATGNANSLFYPGTTNLDQAKPISVAAGKATGSIDIALTLRDSLPIYDVSVYGYFNNGASAAKPAYVNLHKTNALPAVASGIGLDTPNINGRFAGGGAVLKNAPRPYVVNGTTYLALDLTYQLGTTPGPEHLILSTPDFLHVLPSAIRVTTQDPPTIDNVVANADGTLTVSGSNWTSTTAIYFGSLQAAASGIALDAKNNGTVTVTPPVGADQQTVILAAYNPDGQNSQFVQSASPATYAYGSAPAASITSISPATLPAGSESMIDITGAGLNFTAGQVAVGFGTSDIVVHNVYVLSPDHLQVNVGVSRSAVLSTPDVSIVSGFRTATATAGFAITAAVKNLPAPYPLLTNALPGLNGAYAGATVSLYGTNLALNGVQPVVMLNGEASSILFSSAGQINLQIPANLAPGLVTLTVNNTSATSFPVLVNIDSQPATIVSVQDSRGLIGLSSPATPSDLLTVTLGNFAVTGRVIDPGEIQIAVGGTVHAAQSVTEVPNLNQWQVVFNLNANEAPGQSQPLIVYLDGRSSYPSAIPVVTSTGSFTVAPGN